MKPLSRLSVMLLLAAPACVAPPPHSALASPQPTFSPQAFFTGATVGEGVLRVVLSPARQVHVVGDGHVEADGTLVLVQRVEQSGRPTHTRTWHLHPVDGTSFSGTLSDASGPVMADVHGNLLHLRFTGKGGLDVEQWMYLLPGGGTALNRMVVRKLGIPVAALRETIRRTP